MCSLGAAPAWRERGRRKAHQPSPTYPADLLLGAESSRGPAERGRERLGQCLSGTMEVASQGAAPEEVFFLPNLMPKLQIILITFKGFRTTLFLEAFVIFLSLVKVGPLTLSAG